MAAFILLNGKSSVPEQDPSVVASASASASVDATEATSASPSSISSPPETNALSAVADKLEQAGAFAADGTQNSAYEGEGVEQEQEIRFSMTYTAPDRFSYLIAMGEVGIYYYLIEEGETAFEAEIEQDSAVWSETDMPMSQGMDLTSAQLLPQFLRYADVTRVTANAPGQTTIEAVGQAVNYPAVIFRDFLEQTQEDVPFTAVIDDASGELISLELRPSEISEEENITYGSVLTLQFTAFGDEVETPEPTPLSDGSEHTH